MCIHRWIILYWITCSIWNRMRYFGNIILEKYILLFNLMWIYINSMTQSSLQNKGVTHSSMFAEVHFTNASSLPQIPMQCMHCKMLANICMSLLKLIFLWSFQIRVELLSIQIKILPIMRCRYEIQLWTWIWLQTLWFASHCFYK